MMEQFHLCIFCKTQVRELVNINDNGSTKMNFKNIMGRLYGDFIYQFLKDQDLICVSCKLLFENASSLRQAVLSTILDYWLNPELSLTPEAVVFDFLSEWSLRNVEDVNQPKDRPESTKSMTQRNDPTVSTNVRLNSPQPSCSYKRDEVETETVSKRKRKSNPWTRLKKRQALTSTPSSIVQDSSRVFIHNEKPTSSRKMCTNITAAALQLEELYKCTSCTFNTENLDLLTKHRTDIHKEIPWFICTNCKFKCHSQKLLNDHAKEHDIFVATCMYCKEVFHNKKLFTEHESLHSRSNYNCLYCSLSFVRKDLCKRHMKRHSSKKRVVDQDKLISKLIKRDSHKSKFSVQVRIQGEAFKDE